MLKDEVRSQFDWSRALYIRLPEGLVTGFMSGTVGSLSIAILFGKGHPEPLTLAAIVAGGMLGGSILGCLGGLLYAAVESLVQPQLMRSRKPEPNGHLDALTK